MGWAKGNTTVILRSGERRMFLLYTHTHTFLHFTAFHRIIHLDPSSPQQITVECDAWNCNKPKNDHSVLVSILCTYSLNYIVEIKTKNVFENMQEIALL